MTERNPALRRVFYTKSCQYPFGHTRLFNVWQVCTTRVRRHGPDMERGKFCFIHLIRVQLMVRHWVTDMMEMHKGS